MKRKLAATIAAGAAAVLMLSGFDSAMTVQQLQEKSKEALAQVTSLSATLDGNAISTLTLKQDVENGATMDIPINASVTAKWLLNMEPFQTELDVTYNAEAMGQGGNGTMSFFLMEDDDGTAMAYSEITSSDMGAGWTAESVDAESLSQVKETVRSLLAGDTSALNNLSGTTQTVDPAAAAALAQKYQAQLSDLMQIAPESVTLDGKECYQMSAELSGDVLHQMMTDAMALSGQGMDAMTSQMMEAVVGGLIVQISSAIDAQTYLPVSARIDLGASDFTSIQQLLVSSMMGSQSEMSAQLDVSDLSMDCSFNYDPVTISVPQEALNASDSTDLTGGDLLDPNQIGGFLTGSETEDTTSGLDGSGLDDGGLDDSGLADGAVQNPDGSYRITYEDFDGNIRQADISVPEGMELSYGSEDYITFANEDYSLTVSYSLFSRDTPEETVESDLDVSYMEGNTDYSDVTRTDVMQTSLPDGTPVYYGSHGYVYNSYRLGGTCGAVKAGDAIVNIDIQPEDEKHNFVEASEADVQYFAGLVKPAA